jgi:hypothetical protein
MDEEDLNSGLLGIALSDSEDDSTKECAEPAPASREERNAQSEEEFQKLKSTYRVKVENGEVHLSSNPPATHQGSGLGC